MIIRNANFPYPVIGLEKVDEKYLDKLDYTGVSFNRTIDEIEKLEEFEGYNYKLDKEDKIKDFTLETLEDNYCWNIEHRLDDEDLLKLIKDDKAHLIIHLESTVTSFRKIIKVDVKNIKKRSFNKIILIPKDEVRREIEISSFIVANKDIKSFRSKNFNKDIYPKNYYIKDISKGTILGVTNSLIVKLIDKEIKESLPSVIKVARSNNSPYTEIDLDDDVIRVKMTTEDYNIYNQLGSSEYKKIIMSTVLLPTLAYTLERMYDAENSSEENIYKDLRWYNVLIKTLSDKKRSLDNLEDIGSFVLAQEIFKNPISNGLQELAAVSEKEEG